MVEKDKTNVPDPNKEDLEILQQEVEEGGYFGWFGTKKYTENKAMLKAELWQTQKNKAVLKYKVCIIYVENTETFKESYFAGALYEDSGTLLTGFVDKLKETNISSMMPLLNMFASQPQT